MRPVPQSAAKHYRWSALLAQRATREAVKVKSGGVRALAQVVASHQATAALQAQRAVPEMLAEQGIRESQDALLNGLAFTTSTDTLGAMLEQVEQDWQFNRLIASLVQDAGRAAESVASTCRPRIGHVRYLSPPSCSRCAVLAGRVYRYSDGFKRHPGCDCTMIPTTLSNPAFHHDPVDLMRQGLVTGLSKADRQAVADGADFNQVVNVRSSKAGLSESGRILARRGRLTPEAIYRSTNSREDAVQALIRAGYVR